MSRLRMLLVASVGLVLAAPSGALTVAGFGDSLTREPDYLSYLPASWTTLDHGEPGEETWNEGLDRFIDEVLPLLDPAEVDVIVLMEGTNDVRHPEWASNDTVGNLASMALAARSSGFEVVLMAPPPIHVPNDAPGASHAASERVPGWDARLAGVRDGLEAWAGVQGVPFVDLYGAFLDHPMPETLLKTDGVHPNDLGRAFIAARATPVIRSTVPEPTHLVLAALGSALALGSSRRSRRLG